MNLKKLICKISQHKPSTAMLPGPTLRRRCDRCGCVLWRQERWFEVPREQLVAEALMEEPRESCGRRIVTGPIGFNDFPNNGPGMTGTQGIGR